MGDGKRWRGTFDLIVGAARTALKKLDPSYETMPLTIGESGWPSAGYRDASVDNLCEYARNFFKTAQSTDPPLDPYLRTAYYFEAFDEQKKSRHGHGGGGAAEENHFGLFYESGAPKCSSPPLISP